MLCTTPLAKRVKPFSCRKLTLSAPAALAAISLSAGSVQAIVVTVGGVQYDVTTFTGTYNANTSKFALPTNGGVMPWWGSQTLTDSFVQAVGTSFGVQNSGANTGPFFAYLYSSPNVQARAYSYNTSQVASITQVNTNSRVYAQAATLETPVPAPLPLLGAALPLSFCRRLRRRSKRLRHGASSRLA